MNCFVAVFVIIFPPPGFASHFAVPKPRFSMEFGLFATQMETDLAEDLHRAGSSITGGHEPGPVNLASKPENLVLPKDVELRAGFKHNHLGEDTLSQLSGDGGACD